MYHFKLNEKFLDDYKGRQPSFGPLGLVTYARTYSRRKEDGGQEQFWETTKRVVEGCYGIQKEHCRLLGVDWDNTKGQRSAQEMFRRIWDFKFLPPGRGLWLMGTDNLELKSAGLFNCAFRSTENVATDFAEPFAWVFEMLMLGTGVGFDSRGAGLLTIKPPKRDDTVFEVPDCREGWVEALRMVMTPFSGKGAIPASFDFSKVRPAGSPINGFGGVASGPEPLRQLLKTVEGILLELVGRELTVTAINDMMNLIGKTVIAGNVRRSAEISLGKHDDDEFLNLKNPETNQQRLMNHGWAANNSVYAEVGMDYTKTTEMLRKNGEPGYCWLENCRAYGRFKDGVDNRDYRATGTNPCQPAWATVLTPDGIRTIADIAVGSTIWSGKQWAKVSAKWSTGVKAVREYTTCAGTFVGTSNHRIFQNGERCEVGLADAIDTAQGPCPSIKLNPQTVLDGLVIGDGHRKIERNRTLALLDIGEHDRDYFSSEIAGLLGESYSKATTFRITTTVNAALELLPKPEISIPERFYRADVSEVASFLRGLFSANGSVVGNRVTLKATSKKLIVQAQELLSQLGIRSYYTTNHPTEVAFSNGKYLCKESYDLNITTDRNRFAELIGFLQGYKNEKLAAAISTVGMSKYANGRTKHSYEIVSVVELGEHEVFDLTVDVPEHSYWTGGLLVSNCAEQVLEDAECCCLVEVFPARHDSYKDYETTLKYAYLYAKTVTLLKTHSARTNAVMQRNRRIGCSNSGIVQAIQKFGQRNFFSMCDQGYEYLRRLDKVYSEWFCIPRSIRMTTVKPSGSTSLLPGATPGIHFPHSEFYLRRIRFQEGSAMLDVLKKHGYPLERDAYSPNTICVSFPVWEENYSRSKTDVSLWEQLELAAAMQHYWSDNSVSITATFKEEEGKDLKHALEFFESRLKTVSFLPLRDHKYVQAPYEAITEVQYIELMSKIVPVESFVEETHEVTERFCTNDVCTLS